ncbi:NAD(P)-binding domain-containing protein [Pseudomonas frederiksbergensis]|nr:NAD(P)-binding domain-containing protein [Pseudomonas frederiksbergensis]
MISVIGTGSMGSAIAEGLIKAGEEVTVYNRSLSKTEKLAKMGARVAESVAQAIESAEYVIVVLPDAQVTAELLFSPQNIPALKGARLLNVAHTTTEEIKELARRVQEHGGRLSEVNVAVYPDPVRNREGHFNLAATSEDKADWTVIFGKLGDHVHDVGPVGNASLAESAAWLSYMFHAVATAYSAAAFEKLGLPSEALLSALTDNPTLRVASADAMLPQMEKRIYRKDSFSVDNFAYSVGLIRPEAESLGLPTKLIDGIHELFTEASHLGFGSSDVSAVYEAIRPKS